MVSASSGVANHPRGRQAMCVSGAALLPYGAEWANYAPVHNYAFGHNDA